MLISTSDINTKYADGTAFITNNVYNKFARDLYGIRYKKTESDTKVLILLYALNSWDNRRGAVNAFTETQLMGIMDNISKAKRDPMGQYIIPANTGCSKPSRDNGTGIGTNPPLSGGSGSGSITPSLSVIDSSSIALSFINSILQANLKISGQAGNKAVVQGDGLFVGGSISEAFFITGDAFTTGTKYENATLAGKSFIVFHRGLGPLTYNSANSDDPLNEYSIILAGGFDITIPGFDAKDGNNFFTIIVLS